MNEKEEFFEEPPGEPPPRPTRWWRPRGFFGHFFLMALLGLGFLVLCLILVDATNSGGRLKRGLIVLLGGDRAEEISAVEPEPEVVEVPVEKIVERVVERVVEVEVDRPMPSSYVAWQKIDTAKLWSDIPVKTEIETTEGDTAVREREREDSYRIEMRVKLTVPKPNQSVEELASINANLPDMFADFETLVGGAEVSPFYHYLYELKTERIQQKITRLDEILSRHNFYDCETVLEIEHPDSGRKALLVQGEMDVVSDGSDGDRWPELDDYVSMSDYYQPFTSYGWRKQSDRPNPLLGKWRDKLKEYEDEFAIVGLGVERNRYLRAQIETYKRGIADMKARSFLIAEADPFFVLPLSFLGRQDDSDFAPAIGDYGVIIYGNKLYPVIAGDAGPSWKFGEASLRVAKELNENASPYNRPVSDLDVTYLIFPGSADPTKGPPDLKAWRRKCAELVGEIGGLAGSYELHEWEDLVAKRRAEAEAEEEGEAKEETEAEAKKPAEDDDAAETDPAEGESESADPDEGGEGDPADAEAEAVASEESSGSDSQ
ncbi:MAG: glycoside hydrolase family 75 protein [Verrucomicrobiales bacterium]